MKCPKCKRVCDCPDAATPKEVDVHFHGMSGEWAIGEDGYCEVCRPAATPPDNPLIEKLPSSITPEVLVEALGGKHAPPPSDAAQPVAQLLYDTMPDMISAVLVENEIDPFVYAAKWAAAIGPLYAHPEDTPGGPTRLQILEAQRELTAADIAFPHEDGTYSLLLSDTFDFATADAERIPDDEVIGLAQLYKDHGWYALIVWAEDKRGQRVLKPLRKAVDEMRDRLKEAAPTTGETDG